MTIDTIMNPRTPSKADIEAVLRITFAACETIREAGSIPAGTLYAMLIGRVDLTGFEGLIRSLTGAGLVSEKANMLTWIGPKLEGK